MPLPVGVRDVYLIYEDNAAPFSGRRTPYHEQPATRYWLTHFRNSMLLGLFLRRGTTVEKMAASRELAVCQQKMAHWSKHPNYDQEEAQRGADLVKKEWKEP